MKYNLHINQKQAIELGITNINQAHILDLLTTCSTWATPITTDNGIYYWVARQSICKELPLLGIKPDTAYRHLKALADAGFIDYIKDGKKDLVRLTKKGKSYYDGNKSELEQDSEMNPSKLGNKSENNSEINPTDPTTISNHTTKDLIECEFEQFWDLYDKKQQKPKCLAKWKKLKQSEKDAIYNHLPAYLASTPDKQYRKNPLTYLNGECWNDEIVIRQTGANNENSKSNNRSLTAAERVRQALDL